MTRNPAKDGVPHYGWDFSLDYLDDDDPASRWHEVSGGDLPCRIAVRLGTTPSGRPCFTGVRIGEPDGGEPHEVNSKTLRDVSLGNVMRSLREKAVTKDPMWTMPADLEPLVSLPPDLVALGAKTRAGRTLAEVLLGTATPTTLSVPRGPKGDPETDRRTLESYEAACAAGLASSEAVAEVSEDFHVSTSQVYRRMKRARERREGS